MTGVDTNVVLYACHKNDPRRPAARAALVTLDESTTLVVVPQVLQEFLSVITRPPPRGALLSPRAALDLFFGVVGGGAFRAPSAADLKVQLGRIVDETAPRGARVHDAALAAAYLALGVTDLLTFNGGDFDGMGLAIREP